MSLRYKYIALLLSVGSLWPAAARAQEMYVCVWTNPERTMRRIFPTAKDYKTITRRITAEQRVRIERRLGSPLLPGQRDQFQYYEMTDASGTPLGHIIAASQKGGFGAIEFVFGIDVERRIVGMYIQRARERDTAFRNRDFLERFIGRTLADLDNPESALLSPVTVGTKAVFLGLRKELIAFDELHRRE